MKILDLESTIEDRKRDIVDLLQEKRDVKQKKERMRMEKSWLLKKKGKWKRKFVSHGYARFSAIVWEIIAVFFQESCFIIFLGGDKLFFRRAMPEGEHHHRHHHSSSRAHSHSHKNEIVQKSEDPLASVINHHRHKHRHYHHHSTTGESQANKYIWREFEYWAIESKKSQKMQLWIGICAYHKV